MFGCCRDCGGGERSKQGLDAPEAFSAEYVVGELIGIGATAVVHACSRRRIAPRRGWGAAAAAAADAAAAAAPVEEPLCVKVIKKRKFAPEIDLRQLRTEVTVLARLSKGHPSILRALGDFENDRVLCIVMERAVGGELFEQLVTNGRLTEAKAATLVRQVADGLEHCHAHRVIHRDLKPENLLLARPDDLSSGVKIADFGLAAVDRDNNAKTFVGTPGYLAPEIRQQCLYGTKVDVWALGVIVYIMLSGSMPFKQTASPARGNFNPLNGSERRREDEEDEAFVVARVVSTYDPDDTVNFARDRVWKNISDSAKDLIRRCLSIQPAGRFSAMDTAQHQWVQMKKPQCFHRILNTQKLSKFVARRDEPGHNASFFLEPNTMAGRNISDAEKMQKAFRSTPAKPRQLFGRNCHTPDQSPTHSPRRMERPMERPADWPPPRRQAAGGRAASPDLLLRG